MMERSSLKLHMSRSCGLGMKMLLRQFVVHVNARNSTKHDRMHNTAISNARSCLHVKDGEVSYVFYSTAVLFFYRSNMII